MFMRSRRGCRRSGSAGAITALHNTTAVALSSVISDFGIATRRPSFTINLITPDNGEKFLVELDNATLTNIKGFLAPKPDLTLTINRSDLEQTMMGAKTLEAQIADGTAKVEGDASILKQLASTMVDFDPRFEIMPGTKAKTDVTGYVESGIHGKADPYEAIPRQTIAE